MDDVDRIRKIARKHFGGQIPKMFFQPYDSSTCTPWWWVTKPSWTEPFWANPSIPINWSMDNYRVDMRIRYV